MGDCCDKFTQMVEEGWVTEWKDGMVTIDFYDGFKPRGHKQVQQEFILFCPFCGLRFIPEEEAV